MPQRRHALVSLAVMASGAGLTACGAAAVRLFPDLAQARQTLTGLDLSRARTTQGWTLGQVMDHAAQSVEFSLAGFPSMKPAWFRASAGAAAWQVFDARGAMHHGLDEPIPGAPVLDPQRSPEAARQRLLAALARFEAHEGPLAPHFAYGALDKAQYTRAHLMHLANHWAEVKET